MVATHIHLVRHGEVFNPEHVLYGRLPGFGLSDVGHRMAQAAAENLADRKKQISAVFSSPLQRTQESATPIAQFYGLPVLTEPRLIEPTNFFEGQKMPDAMWYPRNWHVLTNPRRPSWGEAYALIAHRMLAAIGDAWASVDKGDVVLVSHQLPIWMVHRSLAGKPLYHNPRSRRCALSSITTFEAIAKPPAPGGASVVKSTGSDDEFPQFIEVRYTNPAYELSHATDVGAA